MTIKNKFKEELESIHKSLIEVSDWMYEKKPYQVFPDTKKVDEFVLKLNKAKK